MLHQVEDQRDLFCFKSHDLTGRVGTRDRITSYFFSVWVVLLQQDSCIPRKPRVKDNCVMKPSVHQERWYGARVSDSITFSPTRLQDFFFKVPFNGCV